ncbi:hypothetical protein [Cupriavidus necator]|uniref:hypothetical protein n=1 Tax=Cupriavidus necator TaxID=106590 RepID=UPI003F73B35D
MRKTTGWPHRGGSPIPFLLTDSGRFLTTIPSVPGLPPATERAFHIVEFAPAFPRRYLSFLENAFHIAEFSVYLIEK